MAYDLKSIFEEINLKHFKGSLAFPRLFWNSRLRTTAGRFIPGRRLFLRSHPPTIEIALYLQNENEAEKHIVDTLSHEMIHYWLWSKRRPHGHTAEFYKKMNEMGVSRYNPIPRFRPDKYVYRCPHCQDEFPTKRKLGRMACLKCCQAFSRGKFHSQFQLYLARELR